ncbi:MAG: DUF4118 domain-containing protein [Acidobacteriota bacterium]
MSERGGDKARSYVLAIVGIAAVSGALAPFQKQLSLTTVALAMLLFVLIVATRWGSGPAVCASVLGALSFNFFFLPPVRTLSITGPQNLVAFAAFLVTAILAGQLSAKARRRAVESEAARKKIEGLYAELAEAFERASQADAWQRSEQLKTALLDAVTHDLRTPLTSIKASATTLLTELRGGNGAVRTLDPEVLREMLEVIDEESDRLTRLIESLVELARIEAGELQLRRRWGVVDDIIGAALKRAEPQSRKHQIEVEIERELPAVEVDARAVSEVIFTLIDNALKYSPAGSTVRVMARRENEEMLQIAVEDQGKGIARDVRERVFDKFFRVSQPGHTGSHPSGMGMGLAIARGLVEAHGGKIAVEETESGSGTRIALTLPIGESEEE